MMAQVRYRQVASLCALLTATPVVAQTVTYLPERGIGVADRARPDYDPIGYRVDGLILYPAVTVDAIYTDNFRATNQNEQEDYYLNVRPTLQAVTDWGRHRVEAQAYVSRSLHANLSQEDVSQYGLSTLGRYDISRDTAVRLAASGRRAVESRTDIGSFRGSGNPVQYDAFDISLAATHAMGDLTLDGAVGAARRDFKDVRANSGALLDQDFRDVRSIFGSASAQYRVGPGLAIVVSGQIDSNDYAFGPGSAGFDPLTTVDRRSNGYSLQAGVNLELTALVYGTLQIGTIHRDYDDPRLRSFDGLSFNARLLWNVTPLTTVRFNAARTVEDTSSLEVAGNLRTQVGLGVDHELYRYIILTADTTFAQIRPNGPLAKADEFAVGVGGRYLIDRNFSLNAALRHSQRTSDLNSFRYTANSASLSVRYGF